MQQLARRYEGMGPDEMSRPDTIAQSIATARERMALAQTYRGQRREEMTVMLLLEAVSQLVEAVSALAAEVADRCPVAAEDQ